MVIVDEARDDESDSAHLVQVATPRKYGPGVTTVTQDVEDFMYRPGRPIITNSSPDTFKTSAGYAGPMPRHLTSDQKNFAGVPVGQGIFVWFARPSKWSRLTWKIKL